MTMRILVDGVEREMTALEEEAFLTQRAADLVPDVPDMVTMRQARLALLESGLLASVNDLIAGLEGDAGEAARIEWQFAREVARAQPLVLTLAPQLGLTDGQLDALFIRAAQL
jgi:hypothetical protein